MHKGLYREILVMVVVLLIFGSHEGPGVSGDLTSGVLYSLQALNHEEVAALV